MASSFKEILKIKLQETQDQCIHFYFIYFRDHILDLCITLFFITEQNLALQTWLLNIGNSMPIFKTVSG